MTSLHYPKLDGDSFLSYIKGNNPKDIEFLAHEVLCQQRKRDAMRFRSPLEIFDGI